MKHLKMTIERCENKSFSPSAVLIGEGLSFQLRKILQKENRYTAIFLFYDKKVKKWAEVYIKELAKLNIKVMKIPVFAGEKLKSLSSLELLATKCINAGLDRKSLMIAMGGGTVGDAIGFLAGTIMRGVDWVGIPTTMLALVDSSVGGKTGVNLKIGKNLMGVFRSPKWVICDVKHTTSLSKREMVSGFGEMIKYSFIFDHKFFSWLEKNWGYLVDQVKLSHLEWAITQSLKWKLKVVGKDPYDLDGIREALNFGHTFGHALESITKYRYFQHGEAIIWGMIFAIHLSEVKGVLKVADAKRALNLLYQQSLPVLPKKLRWKQLLQLMRKDKKSVKGEFRFVLIKDIGHSLTRVPITAEELEKAWKELQGR